MYVMCVFMYALINIYMYHHVCMHVCACVFPWLSVFVKRVCHTRSYWQKLNVLLKHYVEKLDYIKSKTPIIAINNYS